MPGTGAVGKLFFKKFLGDFGSQKLLSPKSKQTRRTRWKSSVYRLRLPARRLVVRKIIRRERLRRRIDFVALLWDKSAAASTRTEVVLTFRTGRSNHGTTGWQTENQSSVRRDANKPSPHRAFGTLPLAVS